MPGLVVDDLDHHLNDLFLPRRDPYTGAFGGVAFEGWCQSVAELIGDSPFLCDEMGYTENDKVECGIPPALQRVHVPMFVRPDSPWLTDQERRMLAQLRLQSVASIITQQQGGCQCESLEFRRVKVDRPQPCIVVAAQHGRPDAVPLFLNLQGLRYGLVAGIFHHPGHYYAICQFAPDMWCLCDTHADAARAQVQSISLNDLNQYFRGSAAHECVVWFYICKPLCVRRT